MPRGGDVPSSCGKKTTKEESSLSLPIPVYTGTGIYLYVYAHPYQQGPLRGPADSTPEVCVQGRATICTSVYMYDHGTRYKVQGMYDVSRSSLVYIVQGTMYLVHIALVHVCTQYIVALHYTKELKHLVQVHNSTR